MRAGLPYGSVMATGSASHLAGMCGVPAVAGPLLWLAIGQATGILLCGLFRHRHLSADPSANWLAVGPPERHAGDLTIPLGLAVIEVGLVACFGPCALAPVTTAGLALVWLATVVFVGRFIASLSTVPLRLHAVDGAWFLAPAVLLGSAIATADALPPAGSGPHRPLAVLAGVAALVGLLGYWGVLAVVCLRVVRYGLAGAPQAPWWIAMGCAGLATAAIANVLQAVDICRLAALCTSLEVTVAVIFALVVMAVMLALALVLWIPIVILSVDFLCHRCRFANHASWPPTFSTAVFAMGGLGLGTILNSDSIIALGRVAGWVTLTFWVVSSAWNVWITLRRWVFG